ncbi:MAG: RNA polymerase sigma factor [bacterium]|nr:RNA polymerase sigma factor [bacterium]
MSDEHSLSDNEILDRSVGEPALFAVLIDRYQKEFLRKIIGLIKNKDDAEDIVQDAFVKVYLNAAKFKARQDATCRAWLYKILLNTCFSYCKKRNRERRLALQMTPEDLDLLSETGNEHQKFVTADRILSTLSRIPQAMANLLAEAFLDGKTYPEIALLEGITEGAVRTRVHRAKEEFKKAFTTYGE